jgi:hypothetical protein
MRRLSQPLKDGIAGIFGWNDAQRRNFEAYKDTLEVAHTGLTYRQWQIALSEEFLKRKVGSDVLGQLFLQYCLQNGDKNTVWVCPDAGFVAELRPLLRAVRPSSMFIIQLIRPGTDFSRDSRSYIEVENVATMQLHNFGEKFELEQRAAHFARLWLDNPA